MTAGAYVIESVEVRSLDREGMDIDASIKTRSFFGKVSTEKNILNKAYSNGADERRHITMIPTYPVLSVKLAGRRKFV